MNFELNRLKELSKINRGGSLGYKEFSGLIIFSFALNEENGEIRHDTRYSSYEICCKVFCSFIIIVY